MFGRRLIAPEPQQTVTHLSHGVKHAVGPVRDVDGDLGSSQLGEGLGVQNEQESPLLLQPGTGGGTETVMRGNR